MKRILIGLLTSLVLVVALFLLLRNDDSSEAQIAVPELIPIADDGPAFALALKPDDLSFPEDFGPHDDYETEWWYYTGNLESENERRFGFQLTFFRRAMPASPDEIDTNDGENTSAWQTNQVYLAHFALSDIESDTFYEQERFSRGAAGLAGAQSSPYRVWLEDWSAEELAPGLTRLTAQADGYGIDLTLSESLPPILHGKGGLSQKGPEPGNASQYYSIVQQEVNGRIDLGTTSHDVSGLAWLDHEFSTSALGPDDVGWDWFSLQLDDGSALMFFEIRQEDGSVSAYSNGTYIHADGQTTPLELGEWKVEELAVWTSPSSGATYPAAWEISVPKLDLFLKGQPLMADQELNTSTTYWEGAVSFEGSAAGLPVSALGYIELTGYAHPMTGRL